MEHRLEPDVLEKICRKYCVLHNFIILFQLKSLHYQYASAKAPDLSPELRETSSKQAYFAGNKKCTHITFTKGSEGAVWGCPPL